MNKGGKKISSQDSLQRAFKDTEKRDNTPATMLHVFSGN
jgi:hypothetical protein